MLIETNFVFSANSLQDYLDCPRRFELKYLLKQNWPAEESEPVLEFEHNAELGNRFHRMVHQYLNGVPQEILLASIQDAALHEWFANFHAFYSSRKFVQIFSEFSLRAVINQSPLVAVCDLIALTADGNLWILDWKTSAKKTRREKLIDRVQTILYPFIALECGNRIFPDFQPRAENIHMAYLFVQYPADNLLTFDYSPDSHQQNRAFLTATIEEILSKEPGTFECTAEARRCRFCVYRSLCERGITAGNLAELEDASDLQDTLSNLDFDAQEEIAF
jgi:RecB family exonuclease